MDTKQRVKNFWKYFKYVQKELEQALVENDASLLQQLRKELQLQVESICDGSCEVEYQNGFFELAFHGGANKTKQYICALLKKEAPTDLCENWMISSYRQPLSETALNTIVEIDKKEYSGSDFTVYYEVDHPLRSVHVYLYHKSFAFLSEEKQLQVANALLELYIGEIELEARIASLQIVTTAKDDVENFCLLPNFYEDLCDLIIDEGWQDYKEPCDIYQVYKLDQALTSETLRNDMKMIITSNTQLQEEILNKELNCVDEARRFGSEYGYLYYEITQEKEKIALVRQQLEKELMDLLYPMAIARTIGGAIGTQYCYIDVIVFDKVAFELLVERLNEHLPFSLYYQSFQA